MISRVSSSNFNSRVNFRGLDQDARDVASSIKSFSDDNQKKETEAVVGGSAAALTATGAKNLSQNLTQVNKLVKDSKRFGTTFAEEVAKHEAKLTKTAKLIGESLAKKPGLHKIAERLVKSSVLKTAGKFVFKPVLGVASVLLVAVDVVKSLSKTKDLASDAINKLS